MAARLSVDDVADDVSSPSWVPTLRLGHLIAIAFIIGIAEGFFHPGYAASLPSVLPEVDLLAANGEGVRYELHTGWVFATLAFAVIAVLVAIGPIEVLVPFAVRDQTGTGAGGYAAVLAGYGLGGASGSIVLATHRLPRRHLTVTLLL